MQLVYSKFLSEGSQTFNQQSIRSLHSRELTIMSQFWDESIYGSTPISKPIVQIDELEEQNIHLFKTEKKAEELGNVWNLPAERWQDENISTIEIINIDSDPFCGYHQLYFKSIIQYQYAIPKSYLSSQAIESSIMNRGDASRFSKMLFHRSTEKCWKILVFGGSVTVANAEQSSHHPGRTRKNGVHRPWTFWLNRLLNSHPNTICIAPVNASGFQPVHEIFVFAEGGRDSAYHLNQILRYRSDPSHVIHSADMIIIESAMNDVFSEDGSHLRTTELLIDVLQQLKNAPALMWLAASLGVGEVTESNIATINQANEQVKVTSLYNIPYMNVPRGFLPFGSSPFKRFWLSCVFKVDGQVHLTEIGLQLVAAYVGEFINEQLNNQAGATTSALAGVNVAANEDKRGPPFYASQEDITIYRSANPLFIDCSLKYIRELFRYESLEFKLMADVPSKPMGLIGFNSLDSFSFTLNKKLLHSHFHNGVIRFDYLVSYDKMGIMCFSIKKLKTLSDTECEAVPTRDTTTLAPAECSGTSSNSNNEQVGGSLLLEERIDALIINGSRISVSITKEFSLDAAQFTDSCMQLRVTVLKASPIRSENKIKINGFYIF